MQSLGLVVALQHKPSRSRLAKIWVSCSTRPISIIFASLYGRFWVWCGFGGCFFFSSYGSKCWYILKPLCHYRNKAKCWPLQTRVKALAQILLSKVRRRRMASSMANISGWDFPDNLRSFVSQILTKQSWTWVSAIYNVTISNPTQRLSYIDQFFNRFVIKAYCTSFVFWWCSKITSKRQGKIHSGTNSVMKSHKSNDEGNRGKYYKKGMTFWKITCLLSILVLNVGLVIFLSFSP